MIYGLLVLNASTVCDQRPMLHTITKSVEHVADTEMLDRMLHIAKHLPSSLHTNNSTELNWCFQKKNWASYPTSTFQYRKYSPTRRIFET